MGSLIRSKTQLSLATSHLTNIDTRRFTPAATHNTLNAKTISKIPGKKVITYYAGVAKALRTLPVRDCEEERDGEAGLSGLRGGDELSQTDRSPMSTVCSMIAHVRAKLSRRLLQMYILAQDQRRSNAIAVAFLVVANQLPASKNIGQLAIYSLMPKASCQFDDSISLSSALKANNPIDMVRKDERNPSKESISSYSGRPDEIPPQ